ncbi:MULTISPECIES: hypothetical protein [unclassified Mesorhizobium]|uniref:hypothetical protein n=1 Tax=unclassified Mesorhizobium TaxID=325217 RepID=UPI00112C6B0F|nr:MULTISPECIES: hypothetical protein [unclassified Mesorhizobium]TPL98035.1 hypothetical protein FJ939_26600 [Mesorhizobium sp. B2-3-8]TPM14195.1 hypothetical protein FJ940_14905 [Mesorhizobium sp. B2-3-7]
MAKVVRHPETRDVWPRALVLIGLGLLVFLALAALGLRLIFDTAPFWPLAGTQMNGSAAGPALQDFPGADLAAFRQQEDRELGMLAWVDRNGGIARIPIDDAMKLIAAQGLPDWAGTPAAAGEDCALLEGEVPRAPQAGICRARADAAQPNARAPQQRQAAPAMETRP